MTGSSWTSLSRGKSEPSIATSLLPAFYAVKVSSVRSAHLNSSSLRSPSSVPCSGSLSPALSEAAWQSVRALLLSRPAASACRAHPHQAASAEAPLRPRWFGRAPCLQPPSLCTSLHSASSTCSSSAPAAHAPPASSLPLLFVWARLPRSSTFLRPQHAPAHHHLRHLGDCAVIQHPH
ncbi:hypothetical protein B0H15DRAFT_457080 [Mycena belliarum]|uniref:Uncharacterized protein n=1 Tax=Mycena belliarum TaxID=1033014 RepID=A0AAD6UHF2_9AGAR|nr:hypothetical protein B0H15DRAFT_457080 [Mycena belliae]